VDAGWADRLSREQTDNSEFATSVASFDGQGELWTEPVLDDYLAAPRDMVPGTSMSYPGLFDDAKRANLVAYLATLR